LGYISLYRKYRSQTFGDLIGQDHVVRTIQNGISSGRIAHAYLFTGPRGTGKTSTARLVAKALCCEHGPTATPDNTCEICVSITAGSCIDVIEMDAASESGVDDIREQIVEVTEYRPMVCRYKIFIIDEVHDLSPKAFDALLKTIEEPPPHIIFILATTEFNKVPPTIRSRCQKYEFHRASLQDLVGRLSYVAEQEGMRIEPAAVAALARMADGGYRDGLTLLEQAILTSEDGEITLQQVYDQLGLVSEEVIDTLLVAIRESNVPAIMETLAAIAQRGRDPKSILESAMVRLQDLTLASYRAAGESSDAARTASLHELSTRLGREFILRMRGDLAEAFKVIRDISLPRLWLESELVRLSLPRTAPRAEAQRAPEPAAAPRPAPRPVAPVVEAAPVETAIAPTPEPAPVAAKTSVGDVTVSPDWIAIMESVQSYSANLHRKLQGVELQTGDGRAVLRFERNIDLDWFQSKPKAIEKLRELVQVRLGSHMAVEFALSKREVQDEQPESVELPLEGDRLEALARQVFGLDGPATR